ncbi:MULTISPECIES: toll/interleukin-1 receptor domain-containing protein [unclassified Micromonospora]|uniref:toll/interleukin-1 receptor domain-containing protein n=1 Tax=unclassified Micromonospora TaxID=2617518 RepID=UPI0003EEA437|nr:MULTISPECIES: toll/interleukin-1 receptor domain-containing protein [unclassified Micromonospora]EWM64140.1 toll-Interleukin receptor [Micromonospora sp. M42]MCK1806972.1 toll/interleukin-1 receptor domain-containing protein [Micromonospora sp. R42106]MCK1831523.1 toll/interleukin-1 receptor domain-containing protein [Micromonospora sp. R42003]MCK1844317.1 toll/interleukin-1 receptor domain-containing protein [Micromonospora sp. R42004]MCM1016109.1 toll/interleukin-1 receptor domain-contain
MDSDQFDFFISYAAPDRAWAEWIAAQLREAGWTVWLDAWEIRPGGNWMQAIAAAVDRSHSVIAVISPQSLGSQRHTTEEWFSFLVGGPEKRVIPVLVAPTEVPTLLRPISQIRIYGLSEEEARTALLSSLAPPRARPSTTPTFPGAKTGDRRLDPDAMSRPAKRRDKKKVFISYSHKDADWLERLLVFLKPIHRDGIIQLWSDKDIKPGQNWRAEINVALNVAGMAIPLISSDFLASDLIVNEELPKLFQAAEHEGTKIMPLILRPSRFERTPILSAFQSVNPPSHPLSALRRSQWEKILANLSDAIEDELSE